MTPRLKRRKVADLRVPGIYFLFDQGEIVYIGRSKDVHGRIRTHAWPSSDKKHAYRGGFDEYAILEVQDEAQRAALEVEYIERYKPAGNRLESRNRRAFMALVSEVAPVPAGAGGGT